MAEPFIGEIQLFPYNFAPNGWMDCSGQLLPISQYSALFSVLDTIYGGDGITTFALPNFEARTVMGAGDGPGLTPRRAGEVIGVNAVTLSESQIPHHAHLARVSKETANSTEPTNNFLTSLSGGRNNIAYGAASGSQPMSEHSVGHAGMGIMHENMQPYLTLRYCIAVKGIYPSRD